LILETKLASKEAEMQEFSGGNALEVENELKENRPKNGEGEQSNLPRCKYAVSIFALYIVTVLLHLGSCGSH